MPADPSLPAASTTKGLELRELGQLRQAASLAKVPAAVTEAEAVLAESDSDKVVLFGCYRETVQRLHERLKRYGACLLTGAVSKAKREALVGRFSSGAARVFIATFEAGGVGCVEPACIHCRPRLTDLTHALTPESTSPPPPPSYWSTDRGRRGTPCRRKTAATASPRCELPPCGAGTCKGIANAPIPVRLICPPPRQTRPVTCVWLQAFALDRHVDVALDSKQGRINDVLVEGGEAADRLGAPASHGNAAVRPSFGAVPAGAAGAVGGDAFSLMMRASQGEQAPQLSAVERAAIEQGIGSVKSREQQDAAASFNVAA